MAEPSKTKKYIKILRAGGYCNPRNTNITWPRGAVLPMEDMEFPGDMARYIDAGVGEESSAADYKKFIAEYNAQVKKTHDESVKRILEKKERGPRTDPFPTALASPAE